MEEVSRYLKWLAIGCLVMALFGIGVFVIGYKDPSFGRVATVVVLLVAASVLGALARRGKS